MTEPEEHNKRFNNLLETYLSNINDDDRGIILWNLTAFPLCDLDMLEKQLKEVREKLDKNISIDLQISEVEEEMLKASLEYEKENS